MKKRITKPKPNPTPKSKPKPKKGGESGVSGVHIEVYNPTLTKISLLDKVFELKTHDTPKPVINYNRIITLDKIIENLQIPKKAIFCNKSNKSNNDNFNSKGSLLCVQSKDINISDLGDKQDYYTNLIREYRTTQEGILTYATNIGNKDKLQGGRGYAPEDFFIVNNFTDEILKELQVLKEFKPIEELDSFIEKYTNGITTEAADLILFKDKAPNLLYFLTNNNEKLEYAFSLPHIPYYNIDGNPMYIDNKLPYTEDKPDIVNLLNKSCATYIKEIIKLKLKFKIEEINEEAIFNQYITMSEKLTSMINASNIEGKFEITLQCKKYNKDIINGYQYQQLKKWSENSHMIDKYLKDQYKYINNLSTKDKTLIKDYTRNASFDLFQTYDAFRVDKNFDNFKDKYIDNKIKWYNIHGILSKEEFYTKYYDTYKQNYEANMLDREEYTLLHYPDTITDDIYKGYINDYMQKLKKFENFNAQTDHEEEYKKYVFKYNLSNGFWYYILELIIKSRYMHLSKDRIFNIFTKNYYDIADNFYDDITNEEWEEILEQYKKDLNDCIIGAPKTPCDFYGYRGSQDDYIHDYGKTHDTPDTLTIRQLISLRFSSVSFSFNSATHYYKLGTNEDTKTLYKVLIREGCNLLFATPLSGSTIKHELELITPLNQVFTSFPCFPRKPAYNNINNKSKIFLYDRDIYNTNFVVLEPFTEGYIPIKEGGIPQELKKFITSI